MKQTLTPQEIRDLALALLDDAHGISANAFDLINPLLEDSGNTDIVNAVQIAKDRAFLDEDAADSLRLVFPVPSPVESNQTPAS